MPDIKAIGVIPSRYASTRFPGKPLALIKGKTLIERVWRQAKKSRLLDEVLIATDDRRIADTAQSFGARVVMTSRFARSGTDRLAEVARKRGSPNDIFINIQGDEPLISPRLIDRLVQELRKDKNLLAVTAIVPLTDVREVTSPHVVKTVVDTKGFALYFSRRAVPYNRKRSRVRYFKHLGIYGYRKKFLLLYSSMARTPLERAEELEQLRILENGFKIKMVVSADDSYGVDTPNDIKKIERFLS